MACGPVCWSTISAPSTSTPGSWWVLTAIRSAWHWTSDPPLSLPKLRSVIEALPDTIYRAKGVVYLEELPSLRIVLQMV